MNTTNFNSSISERKNREGANSNISGKGITIKLLEKYKHRGDNDTKKIQISAQHMSNGSLCDPNQGLTSVGLRFAWKLN